MQIDRYDTGLLGDGGGGNVEWWWDYIRAELERAHEFYAGQIENLTATTVGGDEVPFQQRVQPWMMACFGAEISSDRLERGDRLLEEVLELLQSGNYPPERVAALTRYVFDRPEGEPAQEAGGVMVTLAAYCLAHSLDMHAAGETELARIWTKVDKIRAKQAAKPTGSALPIAAPPPPSQNGGAPFVRQYEDELVGTPCDRCQGNGEIVTDWDRYMHAHDGDVGDEAVAECPDCNGTGRVSQDGAREGEALTFVYRNWRGEVAERKAIPLSVHFGATEWHPEPQWLLRAFDLDKQAERDFAMADMSPATTTPSPDEAVEAERERIISQIARGIEVRQPDGTTAIRAMDEDEIVAMIRSRSAGGAA